MKDMLKKLADNSRQAINDGTYDINYTNTKSSINLIEQIRNNKHASLITEVKFSSPSLGKIRDVTDPIEIAKQMVAGGAVGLSVLTQPYLFNGSPDYFTQIRKQVHVPLLMKDIVVDKIQLDAAEKLGADVVLLIQSIFDNNYAQNIEDFIDYAHKKKLLVLLETHTKQEFLDSMKTKADILGINNRNLDTLEINLENTNAILKDRNEKRIVISESGIESPKDVQFLRKCGADAFLVGSSIMKSRNIKETVSELVNAI